MNAMMLFYGLFMDESLPAEKDLRPTESAIGEVDGIALRIGRCATLLTKANSRAYGALMKIPSEEAAASSWPPRVLPAEIDHSIDQI